MTSNINQEDRFSTWEINCDGYYPYCVKCGEEPPSGKMTKYCPNCGREMKNLDEY